MPVFTTTAVCHVRGTSHRFKMTQKTISSMLLVYTQVTDHTSIQFNIYIVLFVILSWMSQKTSLIFVCLLRQKPWPTLSQRRLHFHTHTSLILILMNVRFTQNIRMHVLRMRLPLTNTKPRAVTTTKKLSPGPFHGWLATCGDEPKVKSGPS